MRRVLIIAEVRLFRESLAQSLKLDGRLGVLATVSDGNEVFGWMQNSPPDAVLFDMGISRAVDIIRSIVERFESAKVVALGVSKNTEAIVEAAEAGIAGYIDPEDSLERLIETVERACRGEFVCSPSTAASLVRKVAKLAAGQTIDHQGIYLTARELDIVRLIDAGCSNKEIASRLCIQPSTAKNHVHNVLEKLGVSRRSEAVAKSRRLGLMSTCQVY